MPLIGLDHVQIAMPPRREADARRFYEELLGLSEIPKPPNLAARGGCWFVRGPIQVHLGVEADFRPARKAHPAFEVTDLDGLAAQLSDAGHLARTDEPLAGWRRVYVDDPFGNRIEPMERATTTDS